MPTGTEPTNGSAPLRHHRSATAITIACSWTVYFPTLPPFSTPHPFTPHPHGVPQAPRSILTPTLPPPLHPGNHFNGTLTTGPRALTPNPQLGDQGATRALLHSLEPPRTQHGTRSDDAPRRRRPPHCRTPTCNHHPLCYPLTVRPGASHRRPQPVPRPTGFARRLQN
jgi:hypothetical protein